MLFAFPFLIGFFAGLRSLTPPAAIAWAAYLGWMKPEQPFTWMGTLLSVVVFTLLAVAELVADKLKNTPNRTAPPGFIARLITGGFAGACIATAAGHGILIGASLGIAGAIVGTLSGFKARGQIVKALAVPDICVAVIEDLIAICGSLWVASRF